MEEGELGLANPQPPSLAGLYRPNTYEGMAWYEREIVVPRRGEESELPCSLNGHVGPRATWLDGKPSAARRTASSPRTFMSWVRTSPRHASAHALRRQHAKTRSGRLRLALYGGVDGNLNGIVGKIELRPTDPVWIDESRSIPTSRRKRCGSRPGSETPPATPAADN